MTVELKELRWFIETIRCGSFRRAAETLHIRQSTLSRRMADMECRLGVSLLERSSSGTKPTVIGREFHDTARHIVEEAEAAICRIKSSNGTHGIHLCLGVHTALSAGNMRATLVEYHRRFPSVELRIEDGSRHHLLSDLSANAIDVVIIINPRDTWKEDALQLWNERIVVALPQAHPLSANAAIRWSEINNECFLINRREPGPEFQEAVRMKCVEWDPKHVAEHDLGVDRMLSLVGAGFGLTLVLEGATGASYPGVVFREIEDDSGSVRMDFTACWRRSNNNPALAHFLDLLRERYPDLQAKDKATG